MSRTVPVGFGDRSVWAWDVSLSILLAQTVQVGEEAPEPGRAPWLAPTLFELRRHAVLGADAYFDLDLGLDAAQREQLLEMVAEASRRLRERGPVTRDEATRWRVLGEDTVLWRGADDLDTTPVADLGQALIDLVHGDLPLAPPGTRWCFGVEGGPRTIPPVARNGS
ncbi:hypothetical protein ACPFP2_08895 [Micromonospora citrea]|uniref:hypothetical protein n=1 Tax=Micromonospora citrea TaxID=47855 RepID=UPI003C5F30BD